MADSPGNPDVVAAAGLIATGSPLLERAWIRNAYGLSDHGDGDAYASSLALLAQEAPNFSTTPLFDPNWVRRQVGNAEAPPALGFFSMLDRYTSQWERDGVSPNPFFPTASYAATAGDGLPTTGLLEDFIRRAEPGPRILFDGEAYTRSLGAVGPALPALGLTAFAHYVTYGWREGRVANRLFDEEWYLAEYPDVADRVRTFRFPNGFSHYLLIGEAENRRPNPFFDPALYLRANQDVASDVRGGRAWSAFRHFWDHGRFEGWRTRRQASAASPTVIAFLREEFPQAAARDAFLTAGAAFAATGIIPAALHVACRHALLDHATPVVAIDAPELAALEQGAPPVHAYLSGIAVLPFRNFAGIEVADAGDGVEARVIRVMPLTASDYLDEDPFGLALHAGLMPGFLAELELEASADAPPGPRAVSLRFSFCADGTTARVVDAFRTIEVHVDARTRAQAAEPGVDAEVCLAAYAPPAQVFDVQVKSILGQHDVRIRLLISDDATSRGHAAGLQAVMASLRQEIADGHVRLLTAGRNLGFAGNFQRAIGMAPLVGDHAILLSDQDDRWHPDKVGTLLQQLQRPGVTCAFSDMTIVDNAGQTLSQTFWRQRAVHYRNPMALAVANTVTGAAAGFSAAALRRLMPFPRFHGLYHDMWLSVGCAALGEIAYVDRPLYDYVQHGENVLGFWGSRRESDERWRLVWRELRHLADRSPADWTERQCEYLLLAGGKCRGPLAQRWVLLSEALRRFGAWHDPQAREDAAALQSLMPQLGHPVPTPGARHAAAWRRLFRQGGGDDALLGLDQLLASALASLHVACRVNGAAAAARIARYIWARDGDHRRAAEIEAAGPLPRRAPVPVVAASVAERTGFVFLLAVLQPPALLFELRDQSFFSGLVSQLTLMDRLLRAGHPVRTLVLDQARADYAQAAKLAAVFPQFRRLLGQMELIAAGTRAVGMAPAVIDTRDVLVATDVSTALVAHDMARALGRDEFLYLIQDDAETGSAAGAERRLAIESYRLPHRAIFSGQLLATHFKSGNRGVFMHAGRLNRHVAFEVPIAASAFSGIRTEPPTVLFHAAPQQAETLYEIGLHALRGVAQRLGPAAAAWRFVAIGAAAPLTVPLSEHATLRLERRLDATSLGSLLGGGQIGLALLDTPNLGAVALTMAAAGLDTVTNACSTKDAASVEAVTAGRVTGRITVTDGTVEGIVAALMSAIARMSTPDDAEKRRLARPWPADASTAFPPRLVTAIVRLGEATLERRQAAARPRKAGLAANRRKP